MILYSVSIDAYTRGLSVSQNISLIFNHFQDFLNLLTLKKLFPLSFDKKFCQRKRHTFPYYVWFIFSVFIILTKLNIVEKELCLWRVCILACILVYVSIRTNKLIKIKNEEWEEDTGRWLGSWFQHICITSRSFGGQFSGIFGVNPRSLHNKHER
jgi:hypothetical protein